MSSVTRDSQCRFDSGEHPTSRARRMARPWNRTDTFRSSTAAMEPCPPAGGGAQEYSHPWLPRRELR
jgi:hypothetical protein